MKRVIKSASRSSSKIISVPQEFFGNQEILKYSEEDQQTIFRNTEALMDRLESELSSRPGVDVDLGYECSGPGKLIYCRAELISDSGESFYPIYLQIKLSDLLDLNAAYAKLQRSHGYKDLISMRDGFFEFLDLEEFLKSPRFAKLFKSRYNIPGDVSASGSVRWQYHKANQKVPVSASIWFDISNYWPSSDIIDAATIDMSFRWGSEHSATRALARTNPLTAFQGWTEEDLIDSLAEQFDPQLAMANFCSGLDILQQELADTGVSIKVQQHNGSSISIMISLPYKEYPDSRKFVYPRWQAIAKSPDALVDAVLAKVNN